jgi:probable F420-dependent oxidoreductase
VLAAAMAAVTTRIHFLSTVYLLPLRHPLAVAKSVATAALVAGDRIELGVGVGWQRDEFDAVGVDFRTRGRRTDEAIGALRELWTPGPTEHHGRFFDFGPLIAEPTLLRAPPIHVGGSSPAAIRRAARLGDGYITMPATSVELAELLPQVREAATREGRDPADLEILANCSDARTADDYGRVADLGADVVLVRPVNLGGAPDLSGVRTGLDQFAARVLEPLARSTEAD